MISKSSRRPDSSWLVTWVLIYNTIPLMMLTEPGGGTLTKKGGMRMCGPLFTPLQWFTRFPFQAKELLSQYTRPPFERILEISTSTASKFAQILVLKPLNLKIFSSLATSFRYKNQFASPHFGNPGRNGRYLLVRSVRYLLDSFPVVSLLVCFVVWWCVRMHAQTLPDLRVS